MLTLENLSFDVNDEKGEKGIIKDISLTVDDGKFVVITGPNGGGKSTTAKLIMGIERPTGGRILFLSLIHISHGRMHLPLPPSQNLNSNTCKCLESPV